MQDVTCTQAGSPGLHPAPHTTPRQAQEVTADLPGLNNGRTGDAVGRDLNKGGSGPPPVSGVGESRLADAGGERSAVKS